MKLLPAIAVILVISSACFAQVHLESLDKAKQIKLLTADRDTVRRALNRSGFEEFGQSDYFETTDAEIEVIYSTGECDENEDEFEIWNVEKDRAVRIEIEPKDDLSLSDLLFDATRFKKEQRFAGVEDDFVYHDKSKGIAIYADSDGVDRIILIPPVNSKAKSCTNKRAQEFISLKSWFGRKKLKDRFVCILRNLHANVIALELSHTEVSGTTSRQIEIATTAIDPENDVLTYSYTVTRGKIIGIGAKVSWDLTGVRPGTYTITVGVDDGAGIVGQTKTSTIVIR